MKSFSRSTDQLLEESISYTSTVALFPLTVIDGNPALPKLIKEIRNRGPFEIINLPQSTNIREDRWIQMKTWLQQFGVINLMTPLSYRFLPRMTDVFFTDHTRHSDYPEYKRKKTGFDASGKRYRFYLGYGATSYISEVNYPNVLVPFNSHEIGIKKTIIPCQITDDAKKLLNIPKGIETSMAEMSGCYFVRRYALPDDAIPLLTFTPRKNVKAGGSTEQYVVSWYDVHKNTFHLCSNPEKINNLENSDVFKRTGIKIGCILSTYIFNYLHEIAE